MGVTTGLAPPGPYRLKGGPAMWVVGSLSGLQRQLVTLSMQGGTRGLNLTCLAGLLPLLDSGIVSCSVGRKPWVTLVSWLARLGWWRVLPREARLGLLVGGLQVQLTALMMNMAAACM